MIKEFIDMEYENRLAQAKEYHAQGLNRVATTPAPSNQKYPIGTRVRINRKARHFFNNKKASILYTYAHAYGGNDTKNYCIDIDGFGQVSWYGEDELTPIAPRT